MLFQNCIEQVFDDMTVSVTANTVFREEFTVTLRCIHAYLEPRLGEFNEREQRSQFVGLCALFVFHFHLFRVVDKRLVKAVWDVQRKLPAIHLYGDVMICPNEFLSRKIPQLSTVVDKRSVDFDAVRRDYLAGLDANIAAYAQTCFMQVATWLVRMEDHNPKDKEDVGERIAALCQMLIQGVLFSYKLSHFVKSFLNLHLDLGAPLKSSHLKAVFRIMELIKSIQQMFHRRSMWIAQMVPHIMQLYSHQAIRVVKACQDKLTADRQYSAKRLDTIAALNLLQSSFNGPPTASRILSIKMAMHVVISARVLTVQHQEVLQSFIVRLETIGRLNEIISTNCNLSFFFWHRQFVTNYLNDLYDTPTEAHRIHYLFAAINDFVVPLQQLKHEESPQVFLDSLEKEISVRHYFVTFCHPFLSPVPPLTRRATCSASCPCLLGADWCSHFVVMPNLRLQAVLDGDVTRRLCRDIENDLRLHIHTGVVKLDDRNPFKVGLHDLSHFLALLPIRFLQKKIDIKSQVTHYLDITFYNLTTVQPNDWKVYGQMRNLAKQKYGLEMQEVHLPSSTLEQGLDVLQIMRNISVFVSSYLYNLNNQIFVERQSNNKFLNTINIRHIANSIRTHGFGIMNTTVNYTYQYLRKKFFQFSQFLYDDHIKSRLIKDLRYFKEVREETDQQYPFERAEKFTKIIRKLGVNDKGESYLDQFRKLITEIGNAMGYIRMIRTGGFHCCSNAVSFVPDLETIISFEELVKDENMSAETCGAAKNVDAAVASLTENFGVASEGTGSEKTEYFKMLVTAFAKEFRDKKNSHLNNFYVMVPPLCLNFVEYMISAKDKISRKNKIGAAFTDDGFAMGVAFILKLLDQYTAFDSLHWFRSCRTHYTKEKEKVLQSRERGREDEKLQQTISLSLKRLSNYERELDLLFYSLSSARIFFRADQTAAEEAEAAKEAGGGAPAADPADPKKKSSRMCHATSR